jgi:glutathione synthase/RimK-type ligase-like ATP-grasp enzyme
MKRIGILHGKENTFPQAFVDHINNQRTKGIHAELAHVDEVMQAKSTGYAVLLDRISQDVPFYRAYLKNAAACGTAVMNNPFWWSADEKFFNNVLAEQIGVPVPKTVLLPSKDMPDDTDANSFRNLKYPMEWEKIVAYLGGFPLYMKPHSGGGWKSVYKVNNFDELFKAYAETGRLVMMLQQEVEFEHYFRCYCLGRQYVHIMPYEPRNPHHLRYLKEIPKYPKGLLDQVEELVLKVNHSLGYDFNTVEFAVSDGVPYAIDFCNPAPDADVHSVGEDNFRWVVEHAAKVALDRAEKHEDGQMNLTWGNFIHRSLAESIK